VMDLGVVINGVRKSNRGSRGRGYTARSLTRGTGPACQRRNCRASTWAVVHQTIRGVRVLATLHRAPVLFSRCVDFHYGTNHLNKSYFFLSKPSLL
jgi:hypothetical protein